MMKRLMIVTAIAFAFASASSAAEPTRKMPDGKTWTTRNLNVETADSYCYDNDDANCAKYGRLYTWSAAMRACPAGYKLPSDADWDALVKAVGEDNAADLLKAKSGWKDNDDGSTGGGIDKHGFAALPGGGRGQDGRYYGGGEHASFWTSTEGVAGGARHRDMNYRFELVFIDGNDKSGAFSVRCVKE